MSWVIIQNVWEKFGIKRTTNKPFRYIKIHDKIVNKTINSKSVTITQQHPRHRCPNLPPLLTLMYFSESVSLV